MTLKIGIENGAEGCTLLLKSLPGLEASDKVVGVDGEFWSPRKVLRRAIWHERDHTAHSKKLLQSRDG
jgi:hypothetical protein